MCRFHHALPVRQVLSTVAHDVLRQLDTNLIRLRMNVDLDMKQLLLGFSDF